MEDIEKIELPEKERKAWLEALRSGKYSKTTGKLKDSSGYCCLGVFGSVIGIDDSALAGCGLPKHLSADIQSRFPEIFLSHEFVTTDDNKLERYFSNRKIPEKKKLISILAGLNDNGYYTFRQIADYIEEITVGV